MTETGKTVIWMKQIRAPFLILAMVLVFIGAASAWWYGYHDWLNTALLLVGVLLTHISVNLFNELSDYRTGIDSETRRTPFSGGSGMMQQGSTSPASVKTVAYATLFTAALIGIYFSIVSGWVILIFMATGGVAIRFYTTHMARWLIGELVSGLTLGSLVVMGVFYALTGFLPVAVIVISLPPGILTSLLLFLNEFPDLEADRQGGRRHLVVVLGRRRSRYLYLAGLIMVYGAIACAPLLFNVPWGVLIALITTPLAVKGVLVVFREYDRIPRLIPALGMNVAVVILTDLLIGIGYLIG